MTKVNNMKYEETKFRLPKKLKKRSKRAIRWSKRWARAQYSAVSFYRTNRWLQGLVLAVFTWLGVFYVLSEFSEPIAVCFATLVVFLLISRIFSD